MRIKKVLILILCFTGLFIFSQTQGNNIPVASNDNYTVKEHEVLSIVTPGILSNDTIPDNAQKTLTIKLVKNVKSGDLNIESDGSFTYILRKNFNGFVENNNSNTDQFSYKIFDGQNYSNEAIVTITIIPLNDPPICFDDHYSIEGNTELIVDNTRGVLSNDRDPEGDLLTVVLIKNVSHGVLNLNYDGSFFYTPYEDYDGDDIFTYYATDGELKSEEVTVMINIFQTHDIDDLDPEEPEETEVP